MDYTYKDSETEFARYIKTNPPKNIWWDFTTYVFDYSDFYFKIECIPVIADSPNQSDEAIIGVFTKHLKAFAPGIDAQLVCENKRIDQIYIVRVFLYFTNYREFSKAEKLFNWTKQKVKSLVTGKADPLGEMLSESIGCCEKATCNPRSDEAKKIDPKHSNIIDCGVLLQIDGKILKAFVEGNWFGFHIWDEKFFHDFDELKVISEQYEIIKV
jgi:hypothetical protein